ncbi:MAG: M14 family zinc carboxypeptidase [Bacteroidetes bacterium]|nr:M14 family zinc carboxypeptidase [Bacteroidota bacterium]
MKKLVLLPLLLLFLFTGAHAQSYNHMKADSLLKANGEIYFSFRIDDRAELDVLTNIISIDNVKGQDVFAYANRSEFGKFVKLGYEIRLLTPPGSMLTDAELMKPANTTSPSGPELWNFYPTYQQYVDTMAYYANAYPSLCKLDTIGTTTQGRLLLAVKISKNVNVDEAKPQFLYTSSIHGDELTSYVGMLHLIEYLLTRYGTDTKVTRLVDSIQIFINPLANPDGTYHGGNNTVNGATRTNANGVDMNRNYPDPGYGPHPDGNAWQPETIAFMNYADSMSFSMSANFHGGSEVFNYPWDTWPRLTADDSWWRFVGREFADTIHKYGPAGYFTDLNNGITDGYAWYTVHGGRQDYMNYFHACREVTVEISSTKTPPASQLISFWNYDYHSYLNYIEQVLYGIHGIVTDTATGLPLYSKVRIEGHDKDSSIVYSRKSNGFYDRLIDQGTWNLTFSKPGYYSKTINNVAVSHYSGVNLNVQLKSIFYGTGELNQGALTIYPVPASKDIHLIFPETDSKKWRLDVVNIIGVSIYSSEINNSGQLIYKIDVSAYPEGVYFIRLSNNNGIYRKQIIVKH